MNEASLRSLKTPKSSEGDLSKLLVFVASPFREGVKSNKDQKLLSFLLKF